LIDREKNDASHISWQFTMFSSEVGNHMTTARGKLMKSLRHAPISWTILSLVATIAIAAGCSSAEVLRTVPGADRPALNNDTIPRLDHPNVLSKTGKMGPLPFSKTTMRNGKAYTITVTYVGRKLLPGEVPPKPHPLVGTILDADWVFGTGQTVTEIVGLNTTDPNCGTIQWGYAGSEPDILSWQFNPLQTQNNQTTTLTVQFSAAPAPGKYQQVINATCLGDGELIPAVGTLELVTADWVNALNNNVVTGKTITTEVGKFTQPKMLIKPTEALQPMWYDPNTIWGYINKPGFPGTIGIGGETFTQSLGSTVSSDPLSEQPILYWNSPGAVMEVYYHGNLTARSNELDFLNVNDVGPQVFYKTIGPTNVTMTTVTNTVTEGPDAGIADALQFGSDSNSIAGIYFTDKATIPTGVSGLVGFTQLFSENDTAAPIPPQPYPNKSGWLDSCPLYDSPLSVTAGTNVTITSDDSPYDPLASSWNTFSENENFTDYFMFKPTDAPNTPPGQKSIWVNLGQLNWSWAGTTTRKANQSWGTPTDVVVPLNPGILSWTRIPVWTNFYGSGIPCSP
jgi:hypothetical protein